MLTVHWQTLVGTQGAIWGTETEDLDATLVRWDSGSGVSEHTNGEVDVVMCVVSGSGTVTVDSKPVSIQSGSVVVIEKGIPRSVQADDDGLVYLNVHKRKKKLMPNMVRPPRAKTP